MEGYLELVEIKEESINILVKEDLVSDNELLFKI